jgi:hypothetical protein
MANNSTTDEIIIEEDSRCPVFSKPYCVFDACKLLDIEKGCQYPTLLHDHMADGQP